MSPPKAETSKWSDFVPEKMCIERNENVKKIAEEAKTIALASKKSSNADLDGWKKWILSGMITLGIILISGVAAWYTQRANITMSLVKTEENVKRIEASVKEIKGTQRGVLIRLDAEIKQNKKTKREDVEELKSAITDAIKEDSGKHKNRKRK